MRVDNQFDKWWTKHLNCQSIPERQVIPVLHMLQDHPELPHLWDQYIFKIIIDDMDLKQQLMSHASTTSMMTTV